MRTVAFKVTLFYNKEDKIFISKHSGRQNIHLKNWYQKQKKKSLKEKKRSRFNTSVD